MRKILIGFCILSWVFAVVYTLSVKADSFLPNVTQKMKQMVLFAGTLDANDTASSTPLIQIGGYGLIGIFSTGTITSTTVIELQTCPDASECIALSPAVEISGQGYALATSVPFRFVRLKVKTAEGEAATASVTIQAK